MAKLSLSNPMVWIKSIVSHQSHRGTLSARAHTTIQGSLTFNILHFIQVSFQFNIIQHLYNLFYIVYIYYYVLRVQMHARMHTHSCLPLSWQVSGLSFVGGSVYLLFLRSALSSSLLDPHHINAGQLQDKKKEDYITITIDDAAAAMIIICVIFPLITK